MFTGLIEKLGQVVANQLTAGGRRLTIASCGNDVQAGESIAVNGVCLTALPESPGALVFDLSQETLRLTTLGCLALGDAVNLERAMHATSRFGGHYVSGHVDTTARVSAVQTMHDFTAVELAGFESEAMRYLIPKGSVTVEGVSLTINAVVDGRVQLMLIPHTLSHTTLGSLSLGQQVNIEFDYLTRIVAHQLQLAGQIKQEIAV